MEERRGTTRSALEALLVDQDTVTDDLVKELLIPYIGLSKTEDRIVPKAEFTNLPQPRRILLYLLARLAMVKLKVPKASLAAESNKIADSSLVQPKSCIEILSRLKAAGLISKREEGWFIPEHSLFRVAAEVRKGSSQKRK